VTVPDELEPGEHYRLAFVTSQFHMIDAMSTDIAEYNALVSSAASSVSELNALETTWSAIVSTPSSGPNPPFNARDNTSTNPNSGPGVPIYNLAGDCVAWNNQDFWDGTHSEPINVNERGGYTSQPVWTGTYYTGVRVVGRELGTTSAIYGFSSQSDSPSWVYNSGTSYPFHQRLPLYAISDPITVVPVPAAIWLLGSGLVFLLGFRRKGKKA
jgi:hypothetical protein